MHGMCIIERVKQARESKSKSRERKQNTAAFWANKVGNSIDEKKAISS